MFSHFLKLTEKRVHLEREIHVSASLLWPHRITGWECVVADEQHVAPDIDREPGAVPADVQAAHPELFDIAAERLRDRVA